MNPKATIYRDGDYAISAVVQGDYIDVWPGRYRDGDGLLTGLGGGGRVSIHEPHRAKKRRWWWSLVADRQATCTLSEAVDLCLQSIAADKLRRQRAASLLDEAKQVAERPALIAGIVRELDTSLLRSS